MDNINMTKKQLKKEIKIFKKKVNNLVNDPNFIKLSELLKKQRKNGNKSIN